MSGPPLRIPPCPRCAGRFISTDQMLDHLQTSHLAQCAREIEAANATEGHFAVCAQGSAIMPPAEQRTPVSAVAVIVLLLLTGAAAILPGNPVASLQMMFVLVVGYEGSRLFWRHVTRALE